MNVSFIAHAAIVVDRIEAVVFGPECTDVITLSDVKRPGIEGRLHSLDEHVRGCKIFQDAKAKHLVDPDNNEKQLKILQRDNDLSDEALDEMLSSMGYKPKEGRDEFAKLTGINSAIAMNVSSKVIISEKEIIDYYNLNPVTLEESYCLQRAEIPALNAASINDLKQQLKNSTLKPSWSSSYWINHSDIDKEKSFIFTMAKGQVHVAENKNYYELFRLVDKKEKRLKPLNDAARNAIEKDLQHQKFVVQFEVYNKELDESTAVLLFKESEKSATPSAT